MRRHCLSVFVLSLVPFVPGCSVQRAKDALRLQMEQHLVGRSEEQAKTGGGKGEPSIGLAEVRKAALAAGNRQVRKIEDRVVTATSVAVVETRRREFDLVQKAEDDIESALAARLALWHRIDGLLARYEHSWILAECLYRRVLEKERKRMETFELSTKPGNEATLEGLLAEVRADNAAVEQRIVDNSDAALPHVKEAHAALEAKIQATLPGVKARRDAAHKLQKPQFDEAVASLEAAANRLRDGGGIAKSDPRLVQRVARDVEEAEAKAAKAEETVDLRPSPWFRMHTGFATLAPYVVRPTTSDERNGTITPANASFVLDESTGSPSFYVETDFLHRWAWLRPEDRTLPAGAGILGDHQWLAPTEHEIRLRFTDTDSIQDSKSAASGDWQAEASLGWSMFDYETADVRRRGDRIVPRGSMTLEVNAGLETDRASNDVHGFIQGGFGSAWSFPIEVTKGVFMPATFFGGIYYGIHSFPRLDTNDAVYSESPRPYYNDLGALGIKIDVVYPLNESFEFVIGGRLAGRFENDSPEDWSLFVGLSLPIGKWLGATDAAGVK